MYNQRSSTSRSENAFTLVELLVVIAIISMLATIITSTFSVIRQNSRDVYRINSLKQVGTAIEFYKIDNGNNAPPHNTNPIGGCTSFCLSSLTDELVPSRIGLIPLDPQYGNVSSNGFRYCRADAIGNTTEYDLMMWNENTGGWCNLKHNANIRGTACWVTNGEPNNGWCQAEI